jgi:hypothetical protein
MRERDVEQYFIRRVREVGGIQRKFVSPGHKDVADRICGFPCGVSLVELKAPGKKPRPGQLREAVKWLEIGVKTYFIDTKEGVDEFIWQMTEVTKR